MNILWVRIGSCELLHHGGNIYSYHLLAQMKRHAHMHVLEAHEVGEVGSTGPAPYAHERESVFSHSMPACSENRARTFLWRFIRNLIFSREPFCLTMFNFGKLAQRIRELDHSGKFDLIIADGLIAAQAFENWSNLRKTPAVLLQHNVEALIWKRLSGMQNNPFSRLFFNVMARRLKRREPQICRLFDGVTTISETDAAYHRNTYKLDNILGCVPAGAIPSSQGLSAAVMQQSSTRRIAFLGSMNWAPNMDAVSWFIEKVLPLVRASVPEIRFRIIGRDPPESLRRLAATVSGIEVTGEVEEVITPLRECSMLVVPLRAGSGVRLKILEAMAAGIPVVSTSIGAEGLNFRNAHDIIVADSSAALSEAILRLLADNDLRINIAQNGLTRVEREYSWIQSAEKLLAFCSKVSRHSV